MSPESESSAPGSATEAQGLPKALERLFLTASGKPACRPFPAEQSLTGHGERGELSWKEAGKNATAGAPGST